MRVGAWTLLLATAAFAEGAESPPPSGRDVTDFSLDDLLNSPTLVASQKAETVRETPSVVTLITREEIQAMGARDLVDILMMVPGFSPPALDVEGVIDVGFRGIWGHEGKILLMIDGEPMNEMLYDDNALGYHYPVDSIQRVEIIRGPGSVLYGGWAELAVVNVISQGAADLKGVSASAFYSERLSGGPLSDATLGQRSLNLAFGQQSLFGVQGLDVTASGFIGQGALSNGTYADFAGNSYGLSAPAANGPLNSQSDPLLFNFGLKYRDLSLRLIVDDYRLAERDSYGTDTGAATGVAPIEKFYTLIADASYDIKLGKLTVSPRFTYKYQVPWQVRQADVIDYADVSVNRYTARVTAAYQFSEALSAMVGTEDYVEKAWLNHPENAGVGSQNLFPGGTCADGSTGLCNKEISYSNVALLGEVEHRSVIGNLTIGARFEHHSAFGDSFVPRIALTKSINRFHFKLLYSLAFRAPGIEDIALSPDGQQIKPERATVAEAEVGYQVTDHLYLSANLFDIVMLNPIVYYVDPNTGVQAYVNFPKTGSQGVEVEARLRYGWGYVYSNYSLYTANGLTFFDLPSSILAVGPQNQVPVYAVPGVKSELIAMPTHKLTVHAKVALSDRVNLNPSLVYFSERWGVQSVDGNGNSVVTRTPPVILANVFLTFDRIVLPGAEVGVGMYNIFDQQWPYLQAYSSGHAPIPAPGREVAIRLTYHPSP